METLTPPIDLTMLRTKVYNTKHYVYDRGVKMTISEMAEKYSVQWVFVYRFVFKAKLTIEDALRTYKISTPTVSLKKTNAEIEERIHQHRIELANKNKQKEYDNMLKEKRLQEDAYKGMLKEQEALNMDVVNDYLTPKDVTIDEFTDFNLVDADAATWHLKRAFNLLYKSK